MEEITKCKTCVHCENDCESAPANYVYDCPDYEQKLSDILRQSKVITKTKLEICQTCIFKGRSCIPNHGEDCSEYQQREKKIKDIHDDPLCKECLMAENCAFNGPTDISEDGKTVICAYFTPKNAVEEKKVDEHVNHPSHYTQGGIECIKCIEASMKPEGFQDYCKGNVIKYIHRWRDKGGVEDLKKAKVYLNWMIESAENGSIS